MFECFKQTHYRCQTEVTVQHSYRVPTPGFSVTTQLKIKYNLKLMKLTLNRGTLSHTHIHTHTHAQYNN